MYCYSVFLPIGLNKILSYQSAIPIAHGARVIVTLNSKLMMGICAKPSPMKQGTKYREILEVLDSEAILPPELFSLADWMSAYYHAPIGKCLFAMLPSRLQIDIDASVAWLPSENPVPTEFQPLYQALKDGSKQKLSDLKKSLPSYPLYSRVELALSEGYISFDRKLKHRDKPKIQNYIIRTELEVGEDTLPLKQREAWDIIAQHPKAFPMASISNNVSYSTIKALVKKGYLVIQPRVVENAFIAHEASQAPKTVILNDEQRQAIGEILEDYGSYRVHLLYGITGSGKTEVYIELIRKYLSDGKGIIFLIPEIALTPQMVDRFDSTFGDILAIQHSQLSDTQRYDQWKKIKSGACRIIIGARSAIFAPVPNLGLIIVDEEHEQSYKQDNSPRYHARDLAIVRAWQQSIQIVLGSATPSLESWNNALLGKYRLHRLSKRPLNYTLPTVKIINLCDTDSKDLISDTLAVAINERLEKKEQVILFQNRRGFSSFVQCMKCGKLITCPNCEISMYYHRDREEMQCHYCGHFYPIPRKCPDCGSYSFSYGSPGTQKVEQILNILFPQAKLLRMDSDSSRHNYNSMYKRMKKGEIDILLGTQMISKGLDFPLVTLVGIINADISLNIPDFRAAERSFQLITQVAGRSGRADKKGEVIIQTYNPEHYAIQTASQQDFESFASKELSYRSRLHYPPAYRIVRILFQCSDLALMQSEMAKLEAITLPLQKNQLFLLGPSPAPFARINQLFRYHLILKAASPSLLSDAIDTIMASFKAPSSLSMQIDVDPAMLM